MFEETIDEIKAFLKDAKSNYVSISYNCKFFEGKIEYSEGEFDYYVGSDELAFMGKMVLYLNLSDAIATFNYSEEGDTLKIADANGNAVIIEK